MSVILGLHVGHDGTAALVVDGRIVAAIGEERLSRTKQHYGFPYLAIAEVLRQGSVAAEQVTSIAIGGGDVLTLNPWQVRHMYNRTERGAIDFSNTVPRLVGCRAAMGALGIGGRKDAEEDALYVVRLDPDARRVIVGPRLALATSRIAVNGLNWLGEGAAPPAEGLDVSVKIRSTMEPVPGRIEGAADGQAIVELVTPEFGVSPGQAAVFYSGGRVLGGGWIQRNDQRSEAV